MHVAGHAFNMMSSREAALIHRGAWTKEALVSYFALARRLDVDIACEQALDFQLERKGQQPEPSRVSRSLDRDLLQIIEHARKQLGA